MKISLIVAKDRKGGIGKNNDLMWHLPADMKFFKETTTGHVVLMGRKNYESIPERFRPLPNRQNIVLTQNKSYQAPSCLVFHSVEDVLAWKNEQVNDERTFFVIGGGEIYRLFLENNLVEEMYITEVDAEFDADTFFPNIEADKWGINEIISYSTDEKNLYNFKVNKYTLK